METSFKKHRNFSVHPTLKITYISRIACGIIGSVLCCIPLYYLRVEFIAQKIIGVFIFWLCWPHIAYRLAKKNRDYKKVERKNILIDAAAAGFCLGLIALNPWPGLAGTLIVHGNSIMIGGMRLLIKTIPCFIAGLLIKFLILGIEINLEPFLESTVVSAVAITAYTLLLSTVSYTQTQKRIKIKKQIKIKNMQLKTLSEKLSEFLAPQLVENILNGQIESVSSHHRKKLTLFFSDIKDFTKITDALEPEDMAELLNEYLSEMNTIINKYQGTLAHVIGDGLFVFFGAPQKKNDKDHAVRCIKMAIDMQCKMKELNGNWFRMGLFENLEIRCGINTGMATVGGYGSAERKEYTAMGMQVNIAARLESICKPGQILISHTTWVLIKDEIPCIEKGKIEIKGYHLPVNVYEVGLD